MENWKPNPELPELCQQLIEDLRAPHLGNQEVATRIQRHPLIADEVIRKANSVQFSLGSEIREITHAISMLGRTRMVALLREISRIDSAHETPKPKAPKFTAPQREPNVENKAG